jgi:hypothetical protein
MSPRVAFKPAVILCLQNSNHEAANGMKATLGAQCTALSAHIADSHKTLSKAVDAQTLLARDALATNVCPC